MSYTPPPPAPAYAPGPVGPRTNTLAIVGFILAFFVSVGAVICSHIALSQIKRTGEGGRGLAIAGLIIGYVGIGIGILWFLFVGIAIIAAIVGGSYSSYYNS
jgi:peptidyl-prolyl cis-trans isomerase B (cyclophilin B)